MAESAHVGENKTQVPVPNGRGESVKGLAAPVVSSPGSLPDTSPGTPCPPNPLSQGRFSTWKLFLSLLSKPPASHPKKELLRSLALCSSRPF